MKGSQTIKILMREDIYPSMKRVIQKLNGKGSFRKNQLRSYWENEIRKIENELSLQK